MFDHNKADLNPTRAEEIGVFCFRRGVPIVGHIPYDTIVTEAMVQGWPVTDYTNGLVSESLRAIWQRIRERL